MVRIPVYDNERPLNTGSEFFRPVSTDAGERDINRGLHSIESGLDQLGNVLMRQQRRDEKFQAEKILIEAEQNTHRLIDKEKENISETGVGFHDRVLSSVRQNIEGTLEKIPESQRQEAELRLQRHLADTSDALAKTEIGQSRNYISTVGKMKVDQITSNVKAGAWTAERAKQEIDTFLGGMQLPPEASALFKREMGRAAEAGRLEYLRTKHPAQFMREVQRFSPDRPSAEAGDIQRLLIEQAKAYGVSPYHLLIVGAMESNFNPNAASTKSSARGVMQLTKGERIRLGAMMGLNEQQMLDPAAQAAAGAIILKEAQTRMEANGIPVTAGTLYMHHFLGPGGSLAMLRADPAANAYEVYRSVAGSFIATKAFTSHPGMLEPNLTVGQVLSRINARVEARGQQVLKYIQPDGERDTGSPITIMGEQFEHVVGADLVGHGAKATATIIQQNAELLKENVKKTYLYGQGIANVYDAKWRKDVDEAAASDKAQEGILSGDKETYARYAAFADRHGYLPKPAAAAALALINSKDRESQFRGYELAARVLRKNPTDGLRLSGIGGDTNSEGFNNAAKVRDYVNLTTHGGFGNDEVGLREAMRRVELLHSPDFKSSERDNKEDIEKRVRARNYSEIEKGLKLREGGWLGIGTTDVGPANPALRRALEDRYQEFFRFHYTERRDTETAKANALADLNRAYNRTRLFNNTLMPMPPERNYPPSTPLPDGVKDIGQLTNQQFQERFGYISDQALAATRQAFGKAADKLTPKDVVMIPDNLTKRDIEAGVAPRYTVAAKIKGEWHIAAREFRADPELGRIAQTGASEDESRAFGTAGTRSAPTTPTAPNANARDKFRAQRGAEPDKKPEASPDAAPKQIRKWEPGPRESGDVEDRRPSPEFQGQSDDQILEKHNDLVRQYYKLEPGEKRNEVNAKRKEMLFELARRGLVDLTAPSAAARKK